MLSKCANPRCSTPFLYLREGKLYRWEQVPGLKRSVASPNPAAKKHPRKVEFFWLCSACAQEQTLVFKDGVGVTTQPIEQAEKLAS